MPLSLKVYNTFRSRWCGAYLQSKGIKVIPTVDVNLDKIFAVAESFELKAGNAYYIDIDTCNDIADMLSEVPEIKVVKVL